MTDGYAVLEGFVAPREVASLADQVDAELRLPRDDSCTRPHNTLLPLRWDHPSVGLILSSRGRTTRLRSAADARDLRWISGYVSIKDPRSPPLAWHQDWWCWDHPVSFRIAAAQVALLCYLNATDEASGALRVIPGSHRARTSVHDALPEPHGGEMASLGPSDPALANQPAQVTIGLRPGDAALVDYRLLHGTHANTGHVRRDCILLSFTPSWRELPEDVRAHLIDHPALPGSDQPRADDAFRALLPRFGGTRRSLPLNRRPPRRWV